MKVFTRLQRLFYIPALGSAPFHTIAFLPLDIPRLSNDEGQDAE